MMITVGTGVFNGPEGEFASLGEAQADRIQHVEALAAALRDVVTRGISPAEMASWPLKLSEARSVFQMPRVGTPMLDAEGVGRGVTTEALALRVLANAEVFAGLEAAIAGNAGKHRDAILALQTVDEVVAYDYRAGWPDLG